MWLLQTNIFVKRGGCGGWDAQLLALQNAADALIFLSYCLIPFALFYALHMFKKGFTPSRRLFFWFAFFILCCGTGHLLTALTTVWPAYRFKCLWDWLTVVASFGAIVALLAEVPESAQA